MSGGCQSGALIDVSVDEAFRGCLPESWLRDVVEAALGEASPQGEACQVSLLVTGDEAVRGLNRDFRGLDEVTDVLSFSAAHPGLWQGENNRTEGRHTGHGNSGGSPFIYPPEEPAPLGEVVISYPQALRQASERGLPLERELALLIVHGVLHLAGHDHLEKEEASNMQTKERAALDKAPQLGTPRQ